MMAGASIAGMGALVARYYDTESVTEQCLLREIMERGIELDGDRREDQARRIIASLSDALKKGSKRSRKRK